MDQFRQIGEVLGSLRAIMVMKHEIPINQRQCILLFDMLESAFDSISLEIKQNLKLEEKNTKWKSLELPMKELYKVFKDADLYIKQCTDIKDWYGRAITLYMSRDCVELHIHNLLACFPVVIEAIETAAEVSGVDQDDMQKRRVALMQKYDQVWDDPKLFFWKFGKQYLVPKDISIRLEMAWREDQWLLLEKLKEKTSSSKHEMKLLDLLINKLSDKPNVKLPHSSILVGSQDYYVKRRLGSGNASDSGHLKEIRWLGESFALRKFYGDIVPLQEEISCLLALSHPNILQYYFAFYDEENKEGFLIMELTSKDLGGYIKENCGTRNKIPFSISIAVEIMLQIGRGMEYLHSKGIYHGDLNPASVLLRSHNGGFQVKITGFSIKAIKRSTSRRNNSQSMTGVDPNIWLAPEVLAEMDQLMNKNLSTIYTEKADVYSFGMLCFELLTGKVPFEDSHLQGEKMVRNIKAGGRPLFSYPAPKYLANLTKKCWQTNPNLRPSFSSICRILRYVKKILVINPDHGHPDSPPPLVDYCDMEAGFLKKFLGDNSPRISHIPFELFAYRIIEKEKTCGKKWDNGIVPIFGDDQISAMDDLFLEASDRRSVCSEIIGSKYSSISTAADLRSVISEIPHRRLASDRSPVKLSLTPVEKRGALNLTESNGKSPLSRVKKNKMESSSSSDDSREVTEMQENKKGSVSFTTSENGTTDSSAKTMNNNSVKRVGKRVSSAKRTSPRVSSSLKSVTPKQESIISSPARTAKKAGFSAASKPWDAARNGSLSKAIKQNVSSSSPSRAFGSPSHPCGKCSRLSRKDLGSSARPQITKTDHV